MFSARASSASAGRASHLLALQSNVSPRRPPPATAARHRPCQQRGYAITPKVPSPTVQRIERVRRSRQPPPPPQSELQPCFRPSAVPPLDFWKACAGDVGLGGLTAEECYNTARQYCAIAVRGDSRWKQALQRDYDIGPAALHCAAMPLFLRAHSEGRLLAVDMLMTAAGLRYQPSIVSLMRLMVEFASARHMEGNMYRLAEQYFRRLLTTDRSPEALTVEGLRLLREGQDARALEYFEQAIAAATGRRARHDAGARPRGAVAARAPRWAYEDACYLGRGRVLARAGRREEAEASLRVAAFELDVADAYLELAQLLPPAAPEREFCLLKAAQGGSLEACSHLALDTAERAATAPELSRADRDFTARMAREWARIEPDSGKRDELLLAVARKLEGAVKTSSGFIGAVLGWLLPRGAR